MCRPTSRTSANTPVFCTNTPIFIRDAGIRALGYPRGAQNQPRPTLREDCTHHRAELYQRHIRPGQRMLELQRNVFLMLFFHYSGQPILLYISLGCAAQC